MSRIEKNDELNCKIILAFAECNMNRIETAKKLNCIHRNTILYRFEDIYIKTGLNPKNFYDLIKLVDIAKGELKMKKCKTCKWFATAEGVCCNGDSEYRADFVDYDFVCEDYEERDDKKEID